MNEVKREKKSTLQEDLLLVRLEPIDSHSGQFMLTCHSAQYAVAVKPEASATLMDWLHRLRSVLVGNDDPASSRDPQDLLRNVGLWLWQALLPEHAPAQERETVVQALRAEESPLLLALPETLAGLPWEFLYDPQFADERGFLAGRRPLVRLNEMATAAPPIEPPLRVLLLISSPPVLGEDSRVDVESERAAVEQAVHEMRAAGFLHLVVEDIVTPKRVERLLDRFKPHIVHYIGHGEYNQANGGSLLWEDEQGNVLEVSAADLASLLSAHPLHAVVLHACETARSDARAGVRSLAGTLAQKGLPAILAQQASLTYESSPLASQTWYKALVAGQNLALALLAVRQVLLEAGRPDWAVPILQSSATTLVPALVLSSRAGVADPLLTSVGAAADVPTPTDVFVGRHRELRALHLMLEDMSDSAPVLALITGPGGMGKSTLAFHAIARYGRSYKAALRLNCQEYRGIDLFLQAMGEFLKRLGAPGFLEQTLPDLQLSTSAKIDQAILSFNAAGPVLLFLDNLESVQNEDLLIGDQALSHLLQRLLTNLRGGRVLIAGRSTVKELLSQKAFEARILHIDLNDLSSYETSQLLLRYPSLARLSKLVREKLVLEFGGLPYVYTLLSSKAASEDLEQILYEVHTYATKDGKTKQKQPTTEQKRRKEWQKVYDEVVKFATLRVIEERLPEVSRLLLAQLSVLHQPFPLAAIEEGLGAARPVWQPLLDWSLLHHDPQEKKYRLHSVTRRYAESLAESSLAEQAHKQTQEQLATWYKRYTEEASHRLADYLEAHRLFRAAGNVQRAGLLALDLADSLRRFGLYFLLHELCQNILSDISLSESSEWDDLSALDIIGHMLVVRAHYELGNLAYLQGGYEEAQDLYQQSLETSKQGPTGQVMDSYSLYQLGMIAQDQGEYEEARRLYQESLATAERVGDQFGQAGTLHMLGNLAYFQRNYEEARELYLQSFALDERLGNQGRQAATLHELGNLAYAQGEDEEAQEFYLQSLEIAERVEDQRQQAATLHQLGTIARDQEQYEEAQEFYLQSLALKEQLGDLSEQAITLLGLGNLASLQKEYEEARSLCQQSLTIFERLGKQQERAAALAQLGTIAQDQGKYEEARRLYQESLAIREQLGDQNAQAASLYILGDLAASQQEYEEAHDFYQQSLALAERLRDQRLQAEVLHRLGTLSQDQQHYEEAWDCYLQSLDIAEQRGDQRKLAVLLPELGDFAYFQEEYEQSRDFHQWSLDIAEQLGDPIGQTDALRTLGMVVQEMREYDETYGLYLQSLNIAERLGDQRRRASALAALGNLAFLQGEIEEARDLLQQSLDIAERVGDQSGRATYLGMVGMVAYQQRNYEKALHYTIQSYLLLEALESPQSASAQQMMSRIRGYLNEETFLVQWQALAGDRPPPPLVEQDNEALMLDGLSEEIATAILQGTAEKRERLATELIEAQHQLPPVDAPMGRFYACLAAALRGEIPEVASLEPPFTELWQGFEEKVQAIPDQASRPGEEAHD